MAMDERHLSGGDRPTNNSQPSVIELVNRRDVHEQTVEFLRRWFGPCADDVQPEMDGIEPVASVWFVHRTDRNSVGNFINDTVNRPVAEAELLIDDLRRDGRLDGNWNVYVRCTTLQHPLRGRRGRADESCQLPGLWIDLDIKDGVTNVDVGRLVEALEQFVPVTAVTYSGGGWHLWTAFTEPIYGVPAIGKVLRRWRHTVRRIGRELGITIDDECSGDPARVMRLVGTANVKLERPAPVLCEFVRHEWHKRINPADLDDVLDEPPEQVVNFKSGPDVDGDGKPGQQFSAAVPMLAVVQAMGGHDWWVDESTGDTYVMRPGKDRGNHGAVVYADGHAAFYSTTWVGPNSQFGFENVKVATSQEVACVYNDSFRLLAHAWFGPEGTGYDRAVEYVGSLGYRAKPQKWTPEMWEQVVARIKPKPRALPSYEQFSATPGPVVDVATVNGMAANGAVAPVVQLPVAAAPPYEPPSEPAPELPPAVRLLLASGALVPPGIPPDVTELQHHQVPTFGAKTLRALAAESKPARPWLVNGVIVSGQAGVLGATPKAGKTMMAADMTFSVASGTPFLGLRECQQGPVIVCLGEGSTSYFRQRLYAIGRSRGWGPDQVDALPIAITERTPVVSEDIDLAGFANVLLAPRTWWSRDPALVIIDPWYLAAAGETEIGNIHSVGKLLERPRLVVAALPRFEADRRPQTADPSLMIVHHYNRDKSSAGAERFSGAGIWAWGRFLIAFDEDPDRNRTVDDDDPQRPTDMVFRVEISGENVATRPFAIRRRMWTINPDEADYSPDAAELGYMVEPVPLDPEKDPEPVPERPPLPGKKRRAPKEPREPREPREPTPPRIPGTAKDAPTIANHIADIMERAGGSIKAEGTLVEMVRREYGHAKHATRDTLDSLVRSGHVARITLKGGLYSYSLVQRPENIIVEGGTNETDANDHNA